MHRVCLSRAGPAAWGIHAPANWDQGDPAVGTRPRHGKRGLIGLADGAARRSHGEAVRTAGHEDEDAAEDEGDPHGGGQGQRFMEKEDPEAGCGEGAPRG